LPDQGCCFILSFLSLVSHSSRWTKTLRFDPLVVVTGRGEQFGYAFYERRGAANVAGWGKNGRPSRAGDKHCVDTAWRAWPINGGFPRIGVRNTQSEPIFGQSLQFVLIENRFWLTNGIEQPK